MQNVSRFLPKIKSLVAKGAVFSMVTLAACVTFGEMQANFGEDNKVYARTSNTTIVSIAEGEMEGIQEQMAQVQLDEEAIESFDESVEAMQSELASELAAQEVEARIARELEEKRIKLSETDKNVLLRIVEAEATGEDIKGKMLVANVVLNRVNNDEFPNSVEQVVFQQRNGKYQFSPIKDGRYYKVSITDLTREAVERVLNGEDESKGALYFMCRRYSSSENVRWFDSSLTKVMQHGTHEFFK